MQNPTISVIIYVEVDHTSMSGGIFIKFPKCLGFALLVLQTIDICNKAPHSLNHCYDSLTCRDVEHASSDQNRKHTLIACSHFLLP